jgi:hypothetical protein
VCILACSLGIRTKLAHSEVLAVSKTDSRTQSDAPPTNIETDPRTRRSSSGTMDTRPSWDLDGLYLWLGPTGAASRIDAQWDSTIGASLSIVRVREAEPLGAIGTSLGASRWTERGGGRVWLDAIVGTRLGRMVGVTAGPILELSELARPRVGASVGAWAFVGVTPFVRLGTVQDLGGFVEIGVHIALPVIRHRH